MQSDEISARQRAVDMLRSGRLEEAKAACILACKADPRSPDEWSLMAAIHAQLGENSQVEVCCRRIIKLKPDDAAARYNLGVALQAQDRHPDSIGSYREALALNPDYAEAWSNL